MMNEPAIAKRKRAVAKIKAGGAVKRKPARKKRKALVSNGSRPQSETSLVDVRDDSSPDRMRTHRRRQASVATILDKTFGKLAESDAQLWDHRAYLMLVGLVYERLATNEQELSTDELVALAKILAENRRAEARRPQGKQTADKDEPPTTNDGPLPKPFADAVREVYGL